MKVISNTIVGIVSVCIWLYAAYFALKWLSHMANDTISYNSRIAAISLPILSILVLLGTIGCIVLLIMIRCGKVRPFWQKVMLALGIIFLLLINGG